MYFTGDMYQVFALLFYGYAILSVFSLYFGRCAFRLPEATNLVYLGKIILIFLFYNQEIRSILQHKSLYVLSKWNYCVCLLPGSSLFKIHQPISQGLTEEQCSTAAQEKYSKKKIPDLTTLWLGADTKPPRMWITTTKILLHVMCSCWKDWKASGDPLDIQKSSPAPSPALPLASHSKMPLSLRVTSCCPRAPENIPQWSGLHIYQITLQLLVRNYNFSYQLNSLSLKTSFDGLWL